MRRRVATDACEADAGRRRGPLALAVLLVVLVVPLAGCAGEYGSTVQPPKAQVEIQDDAFSPERIEVRVNETVMWTNVGDQVHTVESMDGAPVSFASLDLAPGDHFSFTPPEPGTYRYRSGHGSQPTGEIVAR